ncbi:MAG: divergent PAP2 family protein [Clostridia bacterium]|nr:divergent PAP2 family protein [Clostridia bacterium]
MNWFFDLLRNPFLQTAIAGWFASQTMKIFTHAIIYREWDLKRFFGDGGMPSSHSTTVTALTVFAGLNYGFSSFQFAVCMVFTMIVCRDAVGVRLETGKQAMIINELKNLLSNEKIKEIKLKEFVGHTPVQVFAGIVVGIIVALVMNLII